MLLNEGDEHDVLSAIDLYRAGDYLKIRSLNVSDAVICKIIQEKPELKDYILNIRKLSPEVLDLIAREGDDSLKRRISAKYPLLRRTYEFLAQQSDGVKIALCSNKKLPEDIRKELASNGSRFVKQFIKENNL